MGGKEGVVVMEEGKDWEKDTVRSKEHFPVYVSHSTNSAADCSQQHFCVYFKIEQDFEISQHTSISVCSMKGPALIDVTIVFF